MNKRTYLDTYLEFLEREERQVSIRCDGVTLKGTVKAFSDDFIYLGKRGSPKWDYWLDRRFVSIVSEFDARVSDYSLPTPIKQNSIRPLREKEGLTRKELGELIQKSEHTIKKYESGDITTPLGVLIKIDEVLRKDNQ